MAKKRAPRVKRRIAKLYLDENNLDHFIEVKCSNAKRNVFLNRGMLNVLKGRRGTTYACMNANCAMEHKDAFPHPVYLAVFTRRAAYMVDRLSPGRVPIHCVYYEHYNGRDIGIHDILGPQEVVDLGLAEKTIILHAPHPRASGRKGTGTPRSGRNNPDRNVAVIPVGAKKRAKDAGINLTATIEAS